MRALSFSRESTCLVVRAAVAVLCLFFLSPDAFCKMTEDQARELARTTVQKALGRDPQAFLRVSRDVALEQEFRACLPETSRPAPFIFRTSNEGQERTEISVTEHVSVEGPLVFIVAVTDGGRVFLIKGASDSKRQFEDFAQEHSVRLSTADVAREYFRFYLDVNPENFVMSEIASLMQLKEQAVQQFRHALGQKEGLREFNIWWQKYGVKADRLNFDIQVSRTDRGFCAKFYVLPAIGSKNSKRSPRILRASLVGSPQGHIGELRLKPTDTSVEKAGGPEAK